ncbi:MAG TPA: CvpA family protein [Burkholderiales bacterium]|nr:CvpA family protein [Burkholderiales bacterium]
MTAFDYAVLVIVGISILISVIRGLVREVLALLAWLAAFVAATFLGAGVAAWMPHAIPTEELRLLTGFLVVFVGVLIAMSLIAMLVSRLIRRAGLGVEDRMFGMLFGVARGAVVVLLLVLLAGLTPLPRDPMWRNAMLSSPLESMALYVKAWLPGELSRRIKYD